MLGPDTAILILVLIGFVFSIVVHECAHAIVASWCGDDTARLLGRITLNPIPHIDPFMSILLPGALMLAGAPVFGGAKPVPVNSYNLRRPLRDMMWVAAAGPASNLLLAVLFALAGNLLVFLARWDVELARSLFHVLAGIVGLNVILAMFNLIPVPPLDGSRILAYFLPADMRFWLVSLERYGLLIVCVLIYSGATAQLLRPVNYITNSLLSTLIFG